MLLKDKRPEWKHCQYDQNTFARYRNRCIINIIAIVDVSNGRYPRGGTTTISRTSCIWALWILEQYERFFEEFPNLQMKIDEYCVIIVSPQIDIIMGYTYYLINTSSSYHPFISVMKKIIVTIVIVIHNSILVHEI